MDSARVNRIYRKECWPRRFASRTERNAVRFWLTKLVASFIARSIRRRSAKKVYLRYFGVYVSMNGGGYSIGNEEAFGVAVVISQKVGCMGGRIERTF